MGKISSDLVNFHVRFICLYFDLSIELHYFLLFLLWAQITGTNLWDHGLVDIVGCAKSATMLMCVETDETAINLSLCNVSVGRLLSLGYKNLSFGIMCNISQINRSKLQYTALILKKNSSCIAQV